MQESEIQKIIEALIQEGKLFESIEGTDLVNKLYQSFYSHDSLPSFSIDYFSRKKIICAAKHVIKTLFCPQIISTASKNISLYRREKLFPDLLLFNEEEHKLIILEIKRSKKTARETLTEMLAYEHEVKNFLPFFSNFEIQYCILSTEYSSLLNHSITGLITWESKQIICLKVETNKDQVKLQIHFPSAWTSLGSSSFPARAISTSQIILYSQDKDNLVDAESAILYATSLIAKESDRNNSHGFVLAWRDCWENWGNMTGAAKFHLTVGFINPYVFLPFAQKLGIINASQSPLGQYIIKNSEDLISNYSFCSEVLDKGLTFLKKYFHVHIEGLSFWDNERANPHEIHDSIMLTMRHRALPLRIELWGALGDFARDFIIHPGVERHILSGFSGKIHSCEDPLIGIPIIDSISGIKKLDKKGFTCKVLFQLGVSLGTISTLYNTGIGHEIHEIKNLPASITWYMLDIQPILLELGIQYKSSETLTVPPPTVKFTTTNNFKEALSSVQALINWIFKEFLKNQSEIYQVCFNLGLITHPLLDNYLSCVISSEQKKTIKEQIYSISNFLLKKIVDICFSDYMVDETAQSIVATLSKFYLELDSSNVTKDSLNSLVDSVTANKHVELYHSVLIDLVSEVIPSFNQNLLPSSSLTDYKYIDWIWIREEVLRFRDNGVDFPAVRANNLGEISIVNISKENYSSLLINSSDFEQKFIFIVSYNETDIVLVKNWNEIGL